MGRLCNDARMTRLGDCDDERSRWADSKGGGLEVSSKNSVWMTVRQKGRGAKGHGWVMSVTRKQGQESERVIREQEKGSELVME
jgi:hypothetical protein